MSAFSKRYGHGVTAKEITVREDAPRGLREFMIQLMYEFEYKPSDLRRIICRVLRVSPDLNNFSERPNIEFEVEGLIKDCAWYYVYDVIEAFYKSISDEYQNTFTTEINDYFKHNGIGWKLENGQIETRGISFLKLQLLMLARS